MKIIDLIDSKIVISPEALCISPFSDIWLNDKTKDKTLATNQIKYIWFYSDFNSPYYVHPELDRHNMILSDIIKDKKFEITDIIKKGIDKYKELNNSPALQAVDAGYVLMDKIHTYFKDIDLSTVDAKKVMDMFINMPKAITALNEARRNVYSEQTSGVRVRGNADVGMFEDKE